MLDHKDTKHGKEPESQIINEWVLNKENSQLEQHFMKENAGRYPVSFRHYENYANYRLINPEAPIEEYTEIMNT